MVSFEEVKAEEPALAVVEEETTGPTTTATTLSAWEERLLDAQAIEAAASTIPPDRPTARMQLESLAKKLRREADALQRIEKASASSASAPTAQATPPNTPQPGTATAASSAETSEASNKDDVENKAPTPSSSGPAVVHVAPPPTKVNVTPSSMSSSSPSSLQKYVPVDKFAFDAGGYNSTFVTLYIDLPGVGQLLKSKIQCDFTKTSVDLIVRDLNGKSYRLFKDNLEKDIDPSKCRYIVKPNKVVVKLAKVKTSEYGGYDYWTQLTAKKGRKTDQASKENPQASIMELMKDMYDSGDDQMKKLIGETMMKQRNGELGKDGMGGMGGLGGGLGGMDDLDF